jgi:hypothetical protein
MVGLFREPNAAREVTMRFTSIAKSVWLCTSVLLLGGIVQAQSPNSQEPGGTPDDTVMALTKPDEFAWKLFLFINRQAAQDKAGLPAPDKSSVRDYDPDKDTVWESWALASGVNVVTETGKPPRIINDSEVFQNPAHEPPAWDDLRRGPGVAKILSPDFKKLAVIQSQLEEVASPKNNLSNLKLRDLFIAPFEANPGLDEVRMNRSTYETIKKNDLYSVEGVEAAARTAMANHSRSLVTFEPSSKEVKVRWIRLPACDDGSACADKARYHWRTVLNPNTKKRETWGLASLHVITKDLPNWFWADFGHIDCETLAGPCKDQGSENDPPEPAKTPLRDSTTLTSNGERPETQGSKWRFYRLRGAQIDFVSTGGIANIVSNPVIESGFQQSSCMTCHSYASSAARGATLPDSGSRIAKGARTQLGLAGIRNIGSQAGDTGVPACARFFTPGGSKTGTCPDPFEARDPLYVQTDFLWSIPFRVFGKGQ